MVAPRLIAGAARYRVILPSADWYDTETLALVPGGPHDIDSPLGGDSVRVFARAGAIVPEQPLVQNTHQTPSGPLTLTVWPGPDCSGSLYVDDGQSFAFQSGAFRRVALSCEKSETSLGVRAASTGDFTPWWKDVRVVVHALPHPPSSVVDATGEKLPFSYDIATHTMIVSVARSPTDFSVDIAWNPAKD